MAAAPAQSAPGVSAAGPRRSGGRPLGSAAASRAHLPRGPLLRGGSCVSRVSVPGCAAGEGLWTRCPRRAPEAGPVAQPSSGRGRPGVATDVRAPLLPGAHTAARPRPPARRRHRPAWEPRRALQVGRCVGGAGSVPFECGPRALGRAGVQRRPVSCPAPRPQPGRVRPGSRPTPVPAGPRPAPRWSRAPAAPDRVDSGLPPGPLGPSRVQPHARLLERPGDAAVSTRDWKRPARPDALFSAWPRRARCRRSVGPVAPSRGPWGAASASSRWLL